MSRGRSPRLLHVVGALLVASIVCLIIWLVVSDRTVKTGERPNSSASSSDVTGGADSENEEQLTHDRAQINRVAKLFTAAYYSLSPGQSPEMVKKSVAPYVTQEFLDTGVFGLGTSAADMAVVREGSSLEVEALTDLIGEFLDANTVEGTVHMRVTKFDSEGKQILTFDRFRYLELVRQGSTWLVNDAPIT